MCVSRWICSSSCGEGRKRAWAPGPGLGAHPGRPGPERRPQRGLCCFLPPDRFRKAPGPRPRREKPRVLWATDFPWVRDHSPGSKSLCVFNKQPISTSPTPAQAPLGRSPIFSFTWRSSPFQNPWRFGGSGQRVPKGGDVQGLWPGRRARPDAIRGRRLGPQATRMCMPLPAPVGSDIRATSPHLPALRFPPWGVGGIRGNPSLGAGASRKEEQTPRGPDLLSRCLCPSVTGPGRAPWTHAVPGGSRGAQGPLAAIFAPRAVLARGPGG